MFGFSLVSIIPTTLTPNDIKFFAVEYASSLLVKIATFFPTITPHLFK